jgi:hypothetical protein
MAFGFVGAIFAIPALALAGGSGSAAGLGIAGIGGLILIVPAAIYGTFNEAVWTIFFRRMTGRERPVALAYAQPAPGTEGYVPPAPPVPAAPMGYVPPVPVQQPLEVPAPEPVYAPAPEPMPEPAVEPEPVFAPEPEMPAEPEAAAPVDVPPPPASDV